MGEFHFDGPFSKVSAIWWQSRELQYFCTNEGDGIQNWLNRTPSALSIKGVRIDPPLSAYEDVRFSCREEAVERCHLGRRARLCTG